MAELDVIGYTLGDARSILEQGNVQILSVEVTAPPKEVKCGYDDSFRVVGQKDMGENRTSLIVCRPL